MDHRQYLEQYLSADVDGELSDAQRHAVSAHLAGCPDCRRRQSAERAFKAMLRERIPILPAPPELRQRIERALDAESTGTARTALWSRPFWMAAASMVVAAAVLVVFVVGGIGHRTTPGFKAAVADYLKAERGFSPSANLESIDALAVALATEFGYPYVWDFSSLGMSFAGARIEHPENGRITAYSLYRGARGSILCISFRALSYSLPSGGKMVHGVRFYRYGDLSVGVVRYGTVYCLLVTRLTPAQMAPALTIGAPHAGRS